MALPFLADTSGTRLRCSVSTADVIIRGHDSNRLRRRARTCLISMRADDVASMNVSSCVTLAIPHSFSVAAQAMRLAKSMAADSESLWVIAGLLSSGCHLIRQIA
jgi:hypothetical protein